MSFFIDDRLEAVTPDDDALVTEFTFGTNDGDTYAEDGAKAESARTSPKKRVRGGIMVIIIK